MGNGSVDSTGGNQPVQKFDTAMLRTTHGSSAKSKIPCVWTQPKPVQGKPATDAELETVKKALEEPIKLKAPDFGL